MLTLSEIANELNGVWHGNANHAIFNLSSLHRATSNDLACFDNPILKPLLSRTNAGAVLLKSEFLDCCPVNAIVVEQPGMAIRQLAKVFHQATNHLSGIHPTAQIHPSAKIGIGVSIGSNVLIGENVQLGNEVQIGANSVVESMVSIANHVSIGCHVIVHSGTQIGEDVVIDSGCVLGAYPFNYEKEHGVWKTGLVVGGLIISESVSIGSNTVIDRGSINDTYIGKGVCIDNMVLIAQDVFIGENCIIAGCAAIAARAQIGSDCIIGGACSIAANTQLTNDVVISGMSTVTKSIKKPGIYSSGTIVHDHESWRKNAARFKRLDDYIVKLKTLEREMSEKQT